MLSFASFLYEKEIDAVHSTKVDFKRFAKKYVSNKNRWGPGFYFTPLDTVKREYANTGETYFYAAGRWGHNKIVVLSYKKPFKVKSSDWDNYRGPWDLLWHGGYKWKKPPLDQTNEIIGTMFAKGEIDLADRTKIAKVQNSVRNAFMNAMKQGGFDAVEVYIGAILMIVVVYSSSNIKDKFLKDKKLKPYDHWTQVWWSFEGDHILDALFDEAQMLDKVIPKLSKDERQAELAMKCALQWIDHLAGKRKITAFQNGSGDALDKLIQRAFVIGLDLKRAFKQRDLVEFKRLIPTYKRALSAIRTERKRLAGMTFRYKQRDDESFLDPSGD
jgi:hypothetical protein